MAAASGKGKPVYTTRQVGAVLVDASSLLACDGEPPAACGAASDDVEIPYEQRPGCHKWLC